MLPMDDSNLKWTSFFDVRLNRITSHVDKLTVLACQKCDLLRILKTLSVIVVLIEIVLGEKHPAVNYNFGFISVFPFACTWHLRVFQQNTCNNNVAMAKDRVLSANSNNRTLQMLLIIEKNSDKGMLPFDAHLLCCNWQNFLHRIFRWFYMKHWSKWAYLILLFSFGIFFK